MLYQLIPNKQDKAQLIEKHFMTYGVDHPKLLERSVKQPLPFEVKDSVLKLL
ncbi:hypothetical protein [Evansella halocellulosilytica]|uniref:hypothetical protein n=1 Tax=Evansella halocellulosilytica TaxID=2011013 RepID=UPI0015CAA86C|nr:hypothetical protein [Evansella halocellulosilytica]